MMVGERLGNDFEILAALRKSPLSVTYRARKQSTNENVAVSVLDPRAISETSLAQFLADTARLVGRHDPYRLDIHGLGWHGRHPYVVMELPAGRPFSELGPEVSTLTRLHILMGVARGLADLHHLGIVHRGLSPNRIHVAIPMMVKIGELGVSPRTGWGGQKGWEKTDDCSEHYCSPEQIRGLELSTSSDVFVFGWLLYEALTGKQPFHSEVPSATIPNILSHTPESPATRTRMSQDVLGREAADRLDTLVMSCLERQARRRPPDMVRVLEQMGELEQCILAAGKTDTTVVRSTVRNPYGTRVMIRDREGFVGRKQEGQRIFSRLGSDPPGSVAIVGDRKIGKSSLLNYVYTRAKLHLQDPDRLILVFLDFQRDIAWTPGLFAEALLDAIALPTGDHREDDGHGRDLTDVRKAIEQLHQQGNRLIILLDEFEVITSNREFSPEFFAFLRSLAQHYDVGYVTSSAKDLQTLCHDQAICDSPFFNIFSCLNLGPFKPEETRELIQNPSRKSGHPLDAYTDFIRDLAGDFPFHLQMACSLVFDALSQGDVPDLEGIKRRFSQDAEPHFRSLWDSLRPVDREVLNALATGERVHRSRQDVADALISRGYVTKSDASLRITLTPFKEFVLRQDISASAVGAKDHRAKLAWAAGAGGLIAAAVIGVVSMDRKASESRAMDDGSRGRAIAVATSTTAALPVYENSYALVIGAGKYERGWAGLPNVRSDVDAVGRVLATHGFEVENVLDPSEDELRTAFQSFIARHGLREADRLLFYFAGHGFTVKQSYGEEMGYIVPINAPDPAKDFAGFLAKALSMDQVATYARSIQSRHALFVFDACFAGSIFTQSRSGPGHIAFKMDSPVRQFITSGDAQEAVPDRSIFRRQFVAGLEGDADQNGDGYITGSELGEFLLETVVLYSNNAQHPRQGKLRDPNLDKGDFVFILQPSHTSTARSTNP